MKCFCFSRAALVAALVWVASGWAGAITISMTPPPDVGLGAGNPLGAMVEGSFKYESFEEARRLMEERTGAKVVVDAEVAEFMEKLWLKRGEGDPRTETKMTAGQFLDVMCKRLVLQWRFEPWKHVVLLDVGWRREDVRSAKELLQVVMSGSESPGVMPRYSAERYAERRRDAASGIYRERILHDEEWQDAFNALLSKRENFAKAWRVRQQSAAENVFFEPRAVLPVLAQGMVATTGKRYVMVLTYQPIPCYPGHGTFAYYWFEEDGKMVGAGLVTSGWRSDLVEAKVEDNAAAGEPSALRVDLMWNTREPLTARFQLGETGLVRVSLANRVGEEDSFDVGKPVLKEGGREAGEVGSRKSEVGGRRAGAAEYRGRSGGRPGWSWGANWGYAHVVDRIGGGHCGGVCGPDRGGRVVVVDGDAEWGAVWAE